jgi:PAS domain S-box-containing protein
MKFMDKAAETVLAALSEVYALDDVQQIVDQTCARVVEAFPWQRALLSLYFGPDVYVGLAGGDEELRRYFWRRARETTEESRRERRQLIWSKHRIPGTNICFIPAESDVPLGDSFAPSPEDPGAEWQPNDRLMMYVRGADNEVRGVFALDEPIDGKRPDVANPGVLHTLDRFIMLMGVVIHNKHLAHTLRESEERYAAVVEQGHDGFLIVRDEHVVFANRRFGELFGASPETIVGRRLEDVIARDHASTLPDEHEGRLLRQDGRGVDVSLRTSTIRYGASAATLVAVADITERKRILARIVRTQKMETVGTLASGIAHDFNNLLGGIIGYTSLLRSAVGDPVRGKVYVEAIEKAADRAADVTRRPRRGAGRAGRRRRSRCSSSAGDSRCSRRQ